MGGSWTRARRCDPPLNAKQPLVCICTNVEWHPQRGDMDCGLACAQMILRTLDGPGQIPQPVELLAVGEKPSCSDGTSSDSSGECDCSLCCASCASLDGSDVEDNAGAQQQSSGAPSVASSAAAVHRRLSQEAASSDQILCATGCLCTPSGLEKLQDADKPPCAKEKSLFDFPLSRAMKAFCQKQARQLAKRVVKGSWTIDLLLFLQHLPCGIATSYTGYNPNHAEKASLPLYLNFSPLHQSDTREARRVSAQFRRARRVGLQVVKQRMSRASLASEILNGRVAIVLVDEGRLTAKDPSKAPSRQYDGHFVLVCGVAIAIPTADATLAFWGCGISRLERSLGSASRSPQGRKAARERKSGNSDLTVDAAQRVFAAGLTACQVKAFLICDPLHPEARWLTADRLDICRTADGHVSSPLSDHTCRKREAGMSRPRLGTQSLTAQTLQQAYMQFFVSVDGMKYCWAAIDARDYRFAGLRNFSGCLVRLLNMTLKYRE
ncbi:hypothetical protein Esti_000631 [Eimeria stiedai]